MLASRSLRIGRRLNIASNDVLSRWAGVGAVENFATARKSLQTSKPPSKQGSNIIQKRGKFQPKEMLFHSSLQVLLKDISSASVDINEVMFKVRKLTDPKLVSKFHL